MLVLFLTFALFHLCLGFASLGFAIRLAGPEERALWRSKPAYVAASLLCWLYAPIAALCAWAAWGMLQTGGPYAIPVLLAPLLWIVFMGLVFALADFLDDGVLGNAREHE